MSLRQFEMVQYIIGILRQGLLIVLYLYHHYQVLIVFLMCLVLLLSVSQIGILLQVDVRLMLWVVALEM